MKSWGILKRRWERNWGWEMRILNRSYFLGFLSLHSLSPKYSASLSMFSVRISAPLRNRVMVDCGTEVFLAREFADSPDALIASRSWLLMLTPMLQ